MNVLFINFFLFILYVFVICESNLIERKYRKPVFFVLALFQLILIHGLIEPSSIPDIPIYKSVYERLANQPISAVFTDIYHSAYGENFEVGYKLAMSLVGKISNSFTFFLLLNSFILCLLYFRFFYKYSPVFSISVLLFILLPFNQSLFVLRQHLSLAILLLAYPYILNHKPIKFLGIVILATLIHSSSIVFLPVYFLYRIKNKKIMFLALAAMLVIALQLQPLLSLLSIYMANNERYSGYVENTMVKIASKGVIMAIVLFVYCYVMKGEIFKDGINRLVFVISLWGVLFNMMIGEAGAGRIFLCYYFIMLIQIPLIIAKIKNRGIKNIFVISCLSSFFFFTYFLSTDTQSLTELKFLFE